MSRRVVTNGVVRSLDIYRKFIEVDGVSYLFRSSGWHAVLAPMSPDGSPETERPETGSVVALAKVVIGATVAPDIGTLAGFVAQPDVPCAGCGDTGIVECEECGGTATSDHVCRECEDVHECVCPECDENGKVPCEECGTADPALIRGALFDRRIVHDTMLEMGGADAMGVVKDESAGTMYLRNGTTLGIVMGMRLGDDKYPVWEEGSK